MRLDSDTKRDVEDELSWDPDLDAIDIGVTVYNGVMTLGGFVGSYSLRAGLQDRRRHNPTPNDGRFVAVIRG